MKFVVFLFKFRLTRYIPISLFFFNKHIKVTKCNFFRWSQIIHYMVFDIIINTL